MDQLSYFTKGVLTFQGHVNTKQDVFLPSHSFEKYLLIGLHLLKDDGKTNQRMQGQTW